jgi:hypothetical protein
MVGAFAMLLDGLRLLLANWRLTLVQVLPAVWIWLAMFDLKVRVLYGRSFPSLRGPILVPIALAIVAVTVASFFLNAVFAFAITRSRPPEIRPTPPRGVVRGPSRSGASRWVCRWRCPSRSPRAGGNRGLPCASGS